MTKKIQKKITNEQSKLRSLKEERMFDVVKKGRVTGKNNRP